MRRVLFLLCLVIPPSAGAVNFGDSTVSTPNVGIQETWVATKATAPGNGTLDSIGIYLGVHLSGYPAQFFIYKFSDSSLVDSTARTNLSTVDTEWVWLPVVKKASISKDTAYIIGAWADANYKVFMNLSGGDGIWMESVAWSSALSTPWPTPTRYTTRYVAAKAAYTPAPTGPPDYRHGPDGVGLRHGPDGGSVRHTP